MCGSSTKKVEEEGACTKFIQRRSSSEEPVPTSSTYGRARHDTSCPNRIDNDYQEILTTGNDVTWICNKKRPVVNLGIDTGRFSLTTSCFSLCNAILSVGLTRFFSLSLGYSFSSGDIIDHLSRFL